MGKFDRSRMYSDPELTRGTDLLKQVRNSVEQPAAEHTDAPGVDIEVVQMFARPNRDRAVPVNQPRVGMLARLRQFFRR